MDRNNLVVNLKVKRRPTGACEPLKAASTVTAHCFVKGCKYSSKIKWGANQDITDEKVAATVMKERLRKHINLWFDWEKTAGHTHNALSDEQQQEWEEFSSSNNVSKFEVWDKTTLAENCSHHPRNVPADGSWQYQVRRLKADDPVKQQTEACITNDHPILYQPFLLHHWPPTLKQQRTLDAKAASRKRRRSPLYTLAKAAVRGYKRFCEARPLLPESDSTENEQWVEEATNVTKAYITVAAFDWKSRGGARGSQKEESSDVDMITTMTSELRAILAEAQFAHTGVDITLADIENTLL